MDLPDSVLKDIEIFYWTVNGTLDGLRLGPCQSTSGTNVGGGHKVDKSISARFVKCGNYLSRRKNSRDIHQNKASLTKN